MTIMGKIFLKTIKVGIRSQKIITRGHSKKRHISPSHRMSPTEQKINPHDSESSEDSTT